MEGKLGKAQYRTKIYEDQAKMARAIKLPRPNFIEAFNKSHRKCNIDIAHILNKT